MASSGRKIRFHGHIFNDFCSSVKWLLVLLLILQVEVEAQRRGGKNTVKALLCKPESYAATNGVMSANKIVNSTYIYSDICMTSFDFLTFISSDISIGFIVFVVLMIGAYCARQLCPEGVRFAPLQLDEIRIERLDDIESSLQGNINSLKVGFCVLVSLLDMAVIVSMSRILCQQQF